MESSTSMSNDTRGWILSIASAIACVFGACVICVDVFVRLIPGQKSFRIQDSNAFLSSSMSLSFGVMIFSALFSMLPSSKRYLLEDDVPEQAAGFISMGFLVVGFVGIQVVSRVIHSFMPSHVVGCDHSHGAGEAEGHDHSHSHFHVHSGHPDHDHSGSHLPSKTSSSLSRQQAEPTETSPLLQNADRSPTPQLPYRQMSTRSDGILLTTGNHTSEDESFGASDARPRLLRHKSSQSRLRRPSMIEVRDRLLSFVKDTKANCDEFGPCHGYSEPCGQECKRHIVGRSSGTNTLHTVPPTLRHIVTSAAATSGSTTTPNTPTTPGASGSVHHSLLGGAFPLVQEGPCADSESNLQTPNTASTIRPMKSQSSLRNTTSVFHDPTEHVELQQGGNGVASATCIKPVENEDRHLHDSHSGHGHGTIVHHHSHRRPLQFHYNDDGDYHDPDGFAVGDDEDDNGDLESAITPPHHHHVPTNSFMSIGLQTVLAIGLHKFPEGFITYATNHVNPELGFNVFMALFVHNIAEGFAMSLPLYMALGSRVRAIFWASVLGGLSQPIGAGAAAIWLHYLGRNGDGKDSVNGVAYGALFAITAGIMVAVALQLFVESLTLHHNRQLSITFGFLGMLILGLSSSLVKH